MFRSLALGGGGVRAGLQVGALKALEAYQGHLQLPDGLWGCSAGAIVATGLAFGLSVAQMERIYREHLDLTRIVPPPRLTALTSFPTTKGLVSMAAFETEVLAAFKTVGLDLTDMCIEDAKVPLRIVASDLTSQRPTAFTGRVRVLDALKCSACIPFVFEPQVLYGHVYVDGGVSVDCLSSIVPSDCLVLHISDSGTPLYPSALPTLGLSDYLYRIYRNSRGRPRGSNVLWLRNSTVGVLQDLTATDKDGLMAEGDSQMRAFLAKRLAQEGDEPVNGTLPAEVREEGTGL